MYSIFDSHCHLQDELFAGSIDVVLERAREKGVNAMMCCGTREKDWPRVIELSVHRGVFISLGLHPWFIAERSPLWYDNLKNLLKMYTKAGVGEIGLDNAIPDPDMDAQEDIFISQLRLAREMRRPVSIHCRKAFGRLVKILESEGRVSYGGILHSYSGPEELVRIFEQAGLSISFSGAITYSNNKRAHAALLAVSPDNLLIETDSPAMHPSGIASNEPGNLTIILEEISRLTGLTQYEVAALIRNNACRVFGNFKT
ncbi:MAG TPA: hypothetical protein DCO75_11805 [Fibrobacteres bacterium]|jgi:TatD DNase family protein|nr:hypothetical protein [Fibrobacterota bacterium]